MKSPSLSRVLGSHASLLGMASYLVLSGPSAAFAATDSKTVTLNVTITSNITLTQVAVPSTLTIAAGGAASTGDATYTVNTNTYNGYNVTIGGTRCGTPANGILCSGATTLADAAAQWDPTAGAGAGNASATLANGLSFKVMSTSASVNTTWWGTTDSGGTAKWAAVPVSAQQVLTKATPGTTDAFNVRFSVQAPVGQNSGAYTNTTPITFTATTNS